MRIRTVKPEFWSHPVMSRLDDATKLLAIGLLNYSDDEGYFLADPRMVRGALRPLDDDSTIVRRSLDDLSRTEYLEVREHPTHGSIGRIVNFSTHQRVDRANKSKLKPYFIEASKGFDEQSSKVRRLIVDDSSKDQGTGNREQGTGNRDIPPVGGGVVDADPETKTPKPRNELLDALVAVDGSDPIKSTSPAFSAAAKALKDIKEVSPDVTPAEIARRAENYRKHMPGVTISAHSLAKHWAKCEQPPAQQELVVGTTPIWRQIENLQTQLDRHIANPSYAGHHPDRVTPELAADYATKKARLAKLRAQQA